MPKNWNEEYDESKKEFLAKLHKVQAMCQRYSESKTKMMPWWVQALKGAMEAHIGGGGIASTKYQGHGNTRRKGRR